MLKHCGKRMLYCIIVGSNLCTVIFCGELISFPQVAPKAYCLCILFLPCDSAMVMNVDVTSSDYQWCIVRNGVGKSGAGQKAEGSKILTYSSPRALSLDGDLGAVLGECHPWFTDEEDKAWSWLPRELFSVVANTVVLKSASSFSWPCGALCDLNRLEEIGQQMSFWVCLAG